MGRRGRLAPWVALLLVSCARNNPEFGLEGGAGTAADGDGEGDTRGDGGPITQGGEGDTTGGGGGSASSSTTDPVVPETSTSTSAGGSSDSGALTPCEVMSIPGMLDTFVDGTFACGDSCGGLNFGGEASRLVGTEGPTSPYSVYLVDLAPASIAATEYVGAARLHVPLVMEPQADATVMLFPVPPVVFHGSGEGTPDSGVSTWNHQVSMDESWPDPSGVGGTGDFGLVLLWAADAGALVENQMAVDDLVQGGGALYWAEVELSDGLITPLQTNLRGGEDLRFGFTVDSLTSQWVVRALDSGEAPAHLEVEVCK